MQRARSLVPQLSRAACASALFLALGSHALANQETKVVTVDGNPPTGNEPWEICYGEYAQTKIDTIVDFDTFRFFGRVGDTPRVLVHSPDGLDSVVARHLDGETADGRTADTADSLAGRRQHHRHVKEERS